MAMSAQDELTALESAYSALIAGGVSAYSIDGRSITRLDLSWIINRIDILRAVVYRGNHGIFNAARNRPPE